MSAGVRLLGVTHWTGLWLRVDGPQGETLAFDNMKKSARALTGNRDWETHSIVLDVPESASGLFYGLYLTGPGKVWLDGIRVEVVGPDVAVTGRPISMVPAKKSGFSRAISELPRNLDFEE